MSVLKVEFQDQAGNPLASPHVVGVSSAAHDRTQHLQALVTPGAEVSNFTLTVQGKLNISNVNTGTNPITFDLVGTSATDPDKPGAERILATHNTAGTCNTHSVSVLIPAAIAPKAEQKGYDGPVTATNVWRDNYSTPPVWAPDPIPFGWGNRLTTYGTELEVRVADQFGDWEEMGELYVGSAIEEIGDDGKARPNNQQLKSDGTYVDPTGFVMQEQVLRVYYEPATGPYDPETSTYTDIGSAWLEAGTWDYSIIPHEVPVSRPVTVDGFVLDPGVNRTRTLDREPDGTWWLTIVWH